MDLPGLDGLRHTDEPLILHHLSRYVVLVSSAACKLLVLGMYWKRNKGSWAFSLGWAALPGASSTQWSTSLRKSLTKVT